MKLLNDERGVVIAYITVFFCVIAVAIVWICMNELVLNVGKWASTYGTESMDWNYPVLLMFWRLTPVVLLLGSVAWAISKAHQHTSGLG